MSRADLKTVIEMIQESGLAPEALLFYADWLDGPTDADRWPIACEDCGGDGVIEVAHVAGGGIAYGDCDTCGGVGFDVAEEVFESHVLEGFTRETQSAIVGEVLRAVRVRKEQI